MKQIMPFEIPEDLINIIDSLIAYEEHLEDIEEQRAYLELEYPKQEEVEKENKIVISL